MSYSEIRSFTDTMRSLGYPRPLNLSTFFRPNFTAMSDILRWLIDSFGNSNSGITGKVLIDSRELPIELETETDRVMFVKAAAQMLASRLNIKIHTKRLYQSDVSCISELKKLSDVLYAAMVEASRNISNVTADTAADPNNANSTLEEELGDITVDDKTALSVKNLRSLSSEITASGGSLYELLSAEVGQETANSLSLDRLTSLQKPVRMDDVEKAIRRKISELNQKAGAFDQQIARVDEDEAKMAEKINSKKEELARSEQRLETLKSVRPAFQDELDDLEDEMKDSYNEYLAIYRNLSYLKKEIEVMSKQQSKQARRVEQHVENNMQRTMDLNYHNDEGGFYDDEDDDELDSDEEIIDDIDDIEDDEADLAEYGMDRHGMHRGYPRGPHPGATAYRDPAEGPSTDDDGF